jgi:antirestriction protein ArdC
LLWFASKEEDYEDQRFITAKQGFNAGLSMEKGTTGHYIIQRYGIPWGKLNKRDSKGKTIVDPKTDKPIPERDENGKIKYMYKRVSKLVKVFNVSQFTGELPKKWELNKNKVELSNESELVAFRDALESSSEVPIRRENSSQNYYIPQKDEIVLSNTELFRNTLYEISTMTHEMAHATGHKDRLDRESIYRYSEDPSFRGFEELVANFSARAMTNKFGLSNNELSESYDKNHDSYDAGWMKHVLEKNPILIFEATKQAELAFRKVLKPLEEKLKENPELCDKYYPKESEVSDFLANKEESLGKSVKKKPYKAKRKA